MEKLLAALTAVCDQTRFPMAVCGDDGTILHQNELWKSCGLPQADTAISLFGQNTVGRLENESGFSVPLVVSFPQLPDFCARFDKVGLCFTITLQKYSYTQILKGEYDDLSLLAKRINSTVTSNAREIQVILDTLSRRMDDELDYQGRVLVDTAFKKMLQLSHISREISYFDALQKGVLKPHCHNVVMANLLSSLKNDTAGLLASRRVAVQLDHSLGKLVCAVDVELFTFVFASLVSNSARSFSPDHINGHVWITAEAVGDQLQLTVRDNGPGIDKDLIDRAFTPFEGSYSALDDSHGIGLGLYLCNRIVSEWGGKLVMSSTELGTTVRIALPIVQYENQIPDFMMSTQSMLKNRVNTLAIHLSTIAKHV